MSCTNCGTSFNFLRKERGCKLCGYAYCGKCCNVKVIIPTVSEKKKQQICKECYIKLNSKSPKAPNKQASPPLALQRRLQELGSENPVAVTKNEQADVDKELAARLDKVKDRLKAPIVNDQQLRERLSQLKGIPASPQSTSKPNVFGRTNSATETEQSDNLLRQVQQQVKLDANVPDVDTELATRLQKLRKKTDAAQEIPPHPAPNAFGRTNSATETEQADNLLRQVQQQVKLDANVPDVDTELATRLQKVREKTDAPQQEFSGPFNNNLMNATLDSTIPEDVERQEANHDEEDEARRLVKQYMEEAALFQESKDEDELTTDNLEKEDEFPWCIICTGDAEVRCIGCDNDLYCHRCHRECHDKEDLCDHKSIPFEK